METDQSKATPSAPLEGGTGEDRLEEMMERLGLREEDLDDVIFEEEPQPPAESTRWLAIARVHTTREYSDFWFFKNMRSAWDLVQEVKFRSLEDNMYHAIFLSRRLGQGNGGRPLDF
jgi:hypothetical protein